MPWTPALGRHVPLRLFPKAHSTKKLSVALAGTATQHLHSDPRPSPLTPLDGDSSDAKLGWPNKERRAVDSCGEGTVKYVRTFPYCLIME